MTDYWVRGSLAEALNLAQAGDRLMYVGCRFEKGSSGVILNSRSNVVVAGQPVRVTSWTNGFTGQSARGGLDQLRGRCSYCGRLSSDDGRGGCYSCGAPL